MQLSITSRHGNLRPDDHAYVEEKAQKLLKYFNRLLGIQITFDFSKETVTAEIHVDAEHKHDFISRESAAEVRAAFDMALHKMEEQLRRYKERIESHHPR
ncbi:MAG: hypothetical protein KatS3mg113_0199 [Planctomycetaceae bacterium]|nr:MAG: hypothetical protein KatS3mg113_0199 [Planctomycetaceae bacterium]